MGIIKALIKVLQKAFYNKIQKTWYHRQVRLRFLLAIFVPFYWLTIKLRRFFLTRLVNLRRKHSTHSSVPVIVIGNITVGGTGKTPLTISLVEQLRARGYKPGILTCGYGGSDSTSDMPRLVTVKDKPMDVGDEALLLAQKTQVPVVKSTARQRGVEMLSQRDDVDIILSDDGLQHYAMPRDIEIAVVENGRWFGNGMLLPAGPLREPIKRLEEVDFVVLNDVSDKDSTTTTLEEIIPQLRPWVAKFAPHKFSNLAVDAEVPLTAFAHQQVHACVGIGNPDAFFNSLCRLGIDILPQPFRDHYSFCIEDFKFLKPLPIIMTEKDAIKCASFATQRMWVLQTNLVLEQEQEFFNELVNKIEKIQC